MSTIDFIKGVDFTALPTPTAADHNNLADLAEPYNDKGLVLVTTDTALNTPDVPDPSGTARWVRYIWMRKPHITATVTTPILYAWNANATSDATYLKWENVADVATAASTLQAQITALDGRVDVVEVSAANAVTQAGTAATQAAAAVLTSNSANGTALAASANATTALANANTAQTTATNALALATENSAAVTAAAEAKSIADQALAAYAAKVTSTLFSIASGVIGTVTHNLGVPRYVKLVLVNVTPEHGYVANDEIPVEAIIPGSGAVSFSYVANATTVVILCSSTTIYGMKASDGTQQLFTAANWRLKAYIWK